MTTPIQLTDEQVDAYIARVEELIENRRIEGALLSTFDLITGAMVILFESGNQNRIPAKWVFASVRPDMLPEGLLNQAQDLDAKLKEVATALADAEAWLEDLAEMETTANQIRNRLGVLHKSCKAWANP